MFYRLLFAGLFLLFFFARPTHAMKNGIPVPNEDESGSVWVCSPSGCGTGTFLTNQWILTATHVLGAAFGPAHRIYPGGKSNATLIPDFSVNHPTLDLALLHIPQPWPVLGTTSTYRLGLYPSSTQTLIDSHRSTSSTVTCVGRGINDKDESGPAFQGEFSFTGLYDEYNWDTGWDPSSGGPYDLPGDSGGPCFTHDTGWLIGVRKNGGNYSLPENFRPWVLSYLYERPIELPEHWWVWYSSYPKFIDKPLQNNYKNSHAWDPCPSRSYTWSASFDLEPEKDFVYVNIENATTTLTGYNQIRTGQGQGPLSMTFETNDSIQSEGLRTFTIECKHGKGVSDQQLACHGPECFTRSVPVPKNLSLTSTWSPCPNQFSWYAEYDFANSAQLCVDGKKLSGKGKIGPISASGSINLGLETRDELVSGLKYLRAMCGQSAPQPTQNFESCAPTPPVDTDPPLTTPSLTVFKSPPVGKTFAPGQALKFTYAFKNLTNKNQTISIIREFIDAQGKAISRSKAVVNLKPAFSFQRSVSETIKKLPNGKYGVRIYITDIKTKRLILNQGFGIKVVVRKNF